MKLKGRSKPVAVVLIIIMLISIFTALNITYGIERAFEYVVVAAVGAFVAVLACRSYYK